MENVGLKTIQHEKHLGVIIKLILLPQAKTIGNTVY